MLLKDGEIGANVILNVVVSKMEDGVFFPIQTFVINEDVKINNLDEFKALLDKFKKDITNVNSKKRTRKKKSDSGGVRKKKSKTSKSK